jgi:hypothetical protein
LRAREIAATVLTPERKRSRSSDSATSRTASEKRLPSEKIYREAGSVNESLVRTGKVGEMGRRGQRRKEKIKAHLDDLHTVRERRDVEP